MNFKHYIFPFVFLLTLLVSSCNSQFSENPTHRLYFSTDTVRFDTVFTSIGSTTACVMIYNPNKENVKISQVALGKGASSAYRINVDGVTNAQNIVSDIEIYKNDSLYLFVEITINPNESNSPFSVTDYIQFNVNGNTQKIHLEAYGQNVEILKRKLIQNDTTLLGEKPYLVYDYLAVDTAKTLTLAAGCKFYFYDQAQFVVYGNLVANGTLEKPITMRGSRLDNLFKNIPYNYSSGQWDGLYLIQVANQPAFNYHLNYIEINSGNRGINLLGINGQALPKLKLTNSKIHNFSYYGLIVQDADVEVINTEISNTGNYSVFLAGGEHSFIHSTIANYYGKADNILSQPTQRDAKNPAPAVYIYDLSKQMANMSSTFINCIIAGSVQKEFALATTFPKRYNGTFHNNYLRCDSLHLEQFTNNVYYKNNDIIFKNTYLNKTDYEYYNFELDSVSPARNIANKEIANQYPTDRYGRNRLADGEPDAGAYEWVPK